MIAVRSIYHEGRFAGRKYDVTFQGLSGVGTPFNADTALEPFS